MAELDTLISVADSLATGQQLSPESSAWLLGKINDHLAHGKPLVSGYRLAQYRREIRNYWLTQAAGELNGLPWQRAGELEIEIEVFQEMIWPSWEAKDCAPDDSSRLRTFLFNARKCGPLPEGQRQLHDIIKATID